MRWIILIFIVIPALEMFTLIEVGKVMGSVVTVMLVFLTAIIGVVMLRSQGLSTLLSFNRKVKDGEVPAMELISAALLAFAGVLLLLPGFVTDSLGLLLFIPFVRHLIANRIVAKGVLTVTREFEESRVYSFFEENFRQGQVYEAKRRDASSDVKDEQQEASLMLADESAKETQIPDDDKKPD